MLPECRQMARQVQEMHKTLHGNGNVKDSMVHRMASLEAAVKYIPIGVGIVLVVVQIVLAVAQG